MSLSANTPHEKLIEKWESSVQTVGEAKRFDVGTKHSSHVHTLITGVMEEEADQYLSRFYKVLEDKEEPRPQKLQLKLDMNLPILERLIGGDTELEISLRKQIANEFLNRHIPQIMQTEAVLETLKVIKASLADQIGTHVGKVWEASNGWRYTLQYEIKDKIKQIIEAATNEAVEKALTKAIADRVERHYAGQWASHIDTQIKKRFDVDIDKLVNEKVEERIKRMRESLG